MTTAIPLHQLQDRSDLGLELEYFKPGDVRLKEELEVLGAHRDDHYIFFLVEAGSARMMIDFESVSFGEGALYYVLPGQVHHRINADMAYGWFMAVDTGLLTAGQRRVFEERLELQQPIHLPSEARKPYNDLLHLLRHQHRQPEDQPFYRQILYSLLQSFTGMVAAAYQANDCGETKVSRKLQLMRAFKLLLAEQLRTEKSPSAYAEQLHVSPAYLNEALKQTTGLTVSYWIMNEVMVEAKRLLYYSDLNVKAIAHDLGYDDHTYFSRLFKQHNGLTPLAFRGQYRE